MDTNSTRIKLCFHQDFYHYLMFDYITTGNKYKWIFYYIPFCWYRI